MSKTAIHGACLSASGCFRVLPGQFAFSLTRQRCHSPYFVTAVILAYENGVCQPAVPKKDSTNR